MVLVGGQKLSLPQLLLALFLVLGLLLGAARAWSDMDFEIFDVCDLVADKLGAGMTLYDALKVDKTADRATLARSFRKLSLETHPDKHRNDPTAAERFRLISAANNILRDEELRRRYDELMEMGIPRWRGAGYAFRKAGGVSLVGAVFVIIGFITVVQLITGTLLYRQRQARLVELRQETWSRMNPRERKRYLENLPALLRARGIATPEAFPQTLVNEKTPPNHGLDEIGRPRWYDLACFRIFVWIYQLILGIPSVVSSLVALISSKKSVAESESDAVQGSSTGASSDLANASKSSSPEKSESSGKAPSSSSPSSAALSSSASKATSPRETRLLNRKQKTSSPSATGGSGDQKKGRNDESPSADSEDPARSWTQQEQNALDSALSAFPASSALRWEHISFSVMSRSPIECQRRFQELVEMSRRRFGGDGPEALADLVDAE